MDYTGPHAHIWSLLPSFSFPHELFMQNYPICIFLSDWGKFRYATMDKLLEKFFEKTLLGHHGQDAHQREE